MAKSSEDRSADQDAPGKKRKITTGASIAADAAAIADATAVAPAAYQPSIVQGEGGYFWRDAETDTLVGPFATRSAAVADRDSPGPAEDDPDDIAALSDTDAVHEAEAEIGIEDFIDPDTGEPTHGYEPHVRDDH